MNPWFQDAEEHDRHAHMMANRSEWPGDVLHLKHPARIASGLGLNSFAALYSDLTLIESGEGGEHRHFGSVEEILEAGWVVD